MTTPNMTCPEGGRFYACGDGSRYVGCCLSDPCAVGCPAGNLVKTEFDAGQYGQMPDQQCSHGLFYTCAYTDPPFWGCCSDGACAETTGCPASALAGAFLSNNPNDAQVFLKLNTTWAQATATPSAGGGSGANTGAIAGGAVGGVAVLAALMFGICWFHRRRTRRAARENKDDSRPPGAELSGEGLSELAPDTSSKTMYQHVPQHSRHPSPMVPSYHSSPQSHGAQWSPQPPSYQTWGEPPRRPAHVSHELPGNEAGIEMDGGQPAAERPDQSRPSTCPTT